MNYLVCVLATTVLVAAADSPFVGTWKLNVTKSEFTGTTMTFEELPSGEMRHTVEGQTYTFRADGKEYPAMFGSTVTWKQLDARTWESASKVKDKIMVTRTLTLSADGKTLTVTGKGTTPDGTAFEETAVYQRLSGSGLAGKWKTSKVALSSPEIMEFTPSGGDGVVMKVPAYQLSAELTFDGTDHLVTGPTVPANFTVGATRTGDRAFDLVEKVDGKVVYRGKYTVSPDGKTLTAVFSPEGTSEQVKAVYDRQ